MQKIGFNERYGLHEAVLVGIKRMTRRLEKVLDNAVKYYRNSYDDRPEFNIISQRYSERGGIEVQLERGFIFIKTRYKLNEIVAVSQSYNAIKHAYKDNIDVWSNIVANTCDMEAGATNKMFVRAELMPHQIQITDIRIERLQDISDEDCLKEGILKKSNFPRKKSKQYFFKGGKHEWDNSFTTPRQAFSSLINKHGVGRKGLWAENPHVVAYTFKLVK